MHTRHVVHALSAFALSFSGLALAQADKDVRADQANGQRIVTPNHPPGPNYGRPPNQGRPPNYGRPPNHGGPSYRPPNYGRPGYGPGAGPYHNFYRGGHLPREYWNHQYVVEDWRGHHLRRPPRGYYWVQTGGDYVLVAIATGIIADILLNQ